MISLKIKLTSGIIYVFYILFYMYFRINLTFLIERRIGYIPTDMNFLHCLFNIVFLTNIEKEHNLLQAKPYYLYPSIRDKISAIMPFYVMNSITKYQ